MFCSTSKQGEVIHVVSKTPIDGATNRQPCLKSIDLVDHYTQLYKELLQSDL